MSVWGNGLYFIHHIFFIPIDTMGQFIVSYSHPLVLVVQSGGNYIISASSNADLALLPVDLIIHISEEMNSAISGHFEDAVYLHPIVLVVRPGLSRKELKVRLAE